MCIKKGDEWSDIILDMENRPKFSVKDLNMIVYKAEQTGVMEVHLGSLNPVFSSGMPGLWWIGTADGSMGSRSS